MNKTNEIVKYPNTPTLDKMLKVKNDIQVIEMFLDWLTENGMRIAEIMVHHPIVDDKNLIFTTLEAPFKSDEDLLYEYFGIDIEKQYQEQKALLEHVRLQQ